MLRDVQATKKVIGDKKIVTIDGYSTCQKNLKCIVNDIVKAVADYSEQEAKAIESAYTDSELENVNLGANEYAFEIQMNEGTDTYFLVRIILDSDKEEKEEKSELEAYELECDIESALENAESDIIKEWAKHKALVSVVDYDGGYCLTITDYVNIDYIAEVDKLEDLLIYADPDTYGEFSDFKLLINSTYTTHYNESEIVALIKSGFFNASSSEFWIDLADGKDFAKDYIKGIGVIPAEDSEDIAEHLLSEILENADAFQYDRFGFIDCIEQFKEQIGETFKDSVNGVFTNDYFVFKYDFSR